MKLTLATLHAAGCALNVGLFAWHHSPFSIGVATFTGILAIAIMLDK